MIDKKTGELVIESIPLRVGPRLSRSEFLTLPVGKAAKIVVKNEPYCSYNIGRHEISGLVFIVTISFYKELLESISLSSIDDTFGESWSDWSEENELKRKEIHDHWLKNSIGNATFQYKWGEVWSGYDARAGFSSIEIRYSWQGKPWRR